MPPVRPKPAEGGWWTTVDGLHDGNFVLENQMASSPLNLLAGIKAIASGSSGPIYRLVLCGSNYVVARASTKEEALRDWAWAQARYEEEVRVVGSTKLSDHHFLALFEALWQQDHPEDGPPPLETKKEGLYCPELFDAIQNNKKAVVSKLISARGSAILNHPNRLGELPLHFCVSHGNLELTRYLLSKGADPNAKDKTGWTPLHIACHSGDLRMCEFLLKQPGIGVMVISCDNTLPLHYLVSHSFAAEENQLRVVLSMMVEKGASVNSQTAQGTTPLMRAALKMNFAGVVFLLDHGADINLVDKTGENALHYSVRSGEKRMVRLLIDRGINVSQAGDQGTARDVAVRMNRLDMVKLMDVATMMSSTVPGSPFVMVEVPADLSKLSVNEGEEEEEEPRGRRKTLNEVSLQSLGNASKIPARPTSDSAHRARSPSFGSSIEEYKDKGLIRGADPPEAEPKLKDDDLRPIVFELDQPAHIFQITRFSKLTSCDYCRGYIISIGLTRDNYTCTVCGYAVHKKCRKLALFTCKCDTTSDNEFHPIDASNPVASKPQAREELKVAYSIQMDLPSRIQESRQNDPAVVIENSLPTQHSIHRGGKLAMSDISLVKPQLSQHSSDDAIVRKRVMSPPSPLTFTRSKVPPVEDGSKSTLLAPIRYQRSFTSPRKRLLSTLHEEIKVNSANSDTPRTELHQDDGEEEEPRETAPAPQGSQSPSSSQLLASTRWIARSPQEDIRRREARLTRRLTTELGLEIAKKSAETVTKRACKRQPKARMLFSAEELDKIYDQFNEIDVDQLGIITQSQLGRSLGVLMSTDEVTRLLFNAFDPGKTGKVDIKAYVSGMSVMMKGPPDAGLEYAFKMIDLDRNGYIDRFELQLLVDAIYRAMERVDIKLPDDSKTFAEKIILLMADVSGQISLEQYKACILKNTLFFQSLGLIFDSDSEFDFLKSLSCEPKKELSITFGNKDWMMVQNLMLGIRRSVSETTALPAREVTSRDADITVEYKLAHETNSAPWIFKDYSPMIFRKIRETFSCDARLFMFCLGPEKMLGNALFQGNLCALCEVVSTARSGSFFFKSNDGRFFIKTLPPDEFLFLRQILPSYYEYVSNNPNTLLTRFYGMHSMRQGKNPEINFVVMENVFHPQVPVDEQYDLKGSTIDRLVAVEDGKINPSIALKDMNFKKQLRIGGSLKALLMEQVEKDTRWMANLNICDYSFLVGIHSIQQGSAVLQTSGRRRGDPSAFKSFMGGVLSADGEEIYYLAIIDILTQYVFKKKGERLLKSFLHDADQISAMPPVPYQLRFQKYINSIVV